MLKPSNFLLKGWMKFSRVTNQDHGFTMMELLIGLVMAFLVLTPLFGLMSSIMNTDKKEQAKTSSEQELQIAMDFITRDLQQAVYIYGSQGVTSNYNATAASSGIKDSLPTVANGVPVLVFWKRELVSNVIPTDVANSNDDAFKEMEKYRKSSNNPNARLLSVYMVSCNAQIANPNDKNMLDIIGFAHDSPQIILNYLKGLF